MGKELALAIGGTLCISRLGSSLNSFVTPMLYTWTGQIYIPLLVGAILCIISLIAGLGGNYLDKMADIEEGVLNKQTSLEESVSLKDLKELKPMFYLLLLNGFFLYGGFYGLTNNINDLLVKRFAFTPELAGKCIPIIYICAAIMIPMVGMYIDNKGKRGLLMIISSVLFIFDHLTLTFLPNAEPGITNYWSILILFGIGVSYSTYIGHVFL